MGLFKIFSIKVLRPEEEFLVLKNKELEAAFDNSVPEEIALRVSRYRNIHKCLEPGMEYSLVDKYHSLPNDFYRIKLEQQEGERDIDISVSAIVGQNGSGKSTLLEILVRLFNNVAFAHQKAYASSPAVPLQFVEDLYVQMTYQMPEGEVFQLEQRGAVLRCLAQGQVCWQYDNHEMNFVEGADAIYYLSSYFFFTIVLNYSAYSYNLYNFRPEWCDLSQNDGFEYTDEDRCWAECHLP